MTPGRFREVLGLLRWSHRSLSEQLGCDERLIRRWSAGGADIPGVVGEWLEALAAAHVALPVPTTWRQRAA